MQTSRAIKKKDSRHRILQAASKRLRREGLDGASIATVMNDAGLTHGTFNAHFKNKDELTIEAFKHSTILDIAEIGDRADNPEKYDQSVALLALWIGGLNLSRNVDDNIKSDHILKVCNQASARLIDG